MEAISGTASEYAGSSSRGPLQPKTSSKSSKQVKRKSSFLLRSDSSDDFPSPHDSIFEAIYISTTNSDDFSNRIELITIPPRKLNTQTRISNGNDENSREKSSTPVPPQVDNVEFLYGHGTLLDTITEQKSNATMRTLARPKSADHMPSVPFLSHQDSFILAKKLRRKESLSLDDLALVSDSYHTACTVIERDSRRRLLIDEVYAEPKVPIHAPLKRPPTPPGLPSWTEAQNMRQSRGSSRNQAGTQNRIQRFLRLPVSGVLHSSLLSGSRTASSPLTGRAAPRFRPPRSVYGTLSQHPFSSAPIAKASCTPPENRPCNTSGISRIPRLAKKGKSSQHVRFTTSVMSRDHQANAASGTAASDGLDGGLGNAESIQIPGPQCQPRRASPTTPRSTIQNVPIALGEPIVVVQPAMAPTTSSATPQTASSSQHDSPDLGGSRSVSLSSTARLVSGKSGLPDDSSRYCFVHAPTRSKLNSIQSPVTIESCWKCRMQKTIVRLDKIRMQVAGCLCLACYGFDEQDNETVTPVTSAGTRGAGPIIQYSEPRSYQSSSAGYGFKTRTQLSDSVLHHSEPRSYQTAGPGQNSHQSPDMYSRSGETTCRQIILQQTPVVCS